MNEIFELKDKKITKKENKVLKIEECATSGTMRYGTRHWKVKDKLKCGVDTY